MKVVVWGHPLHSHTHSYIHESFVKGFKTLGYETHWMHGGMDVSGFDFSNCLLLTEGQVDQRIPLRKDCKYILHNCNKKKYDGLNAVLLQVYTDDVVKYNYAPSVEKCIHVSGRLIFQPWATDLLPGEINPEDNMFCLTRTNQVWFIGTCGDGLFGNKPQVDALRSACAKHGLSLMVDNAIPTTEAMAKIRSSYFAPSIQGSWQVENGYIPCRIFKNVSYGQLGMTNNKRVEEIMEGLVVYAPDMESLVSKSVDEIKSGRGRDTVIKAMRLVRDRHTYISRIQRIMSLFDN